MKWIKSRLFKQTLDKRKRFMLSAITFALLLCALGFQNCVGGQALFGLLGGGVKAHAVFSSGTNQDVCERCWNSGYTYCYKDGSLNAWCSSTWDPGVGAAYTEPPSTDYSGGGGAGPDATPQPSLVVGTIPPSQFEGIFEVI